MAGNASRSSSPLHALTAAGGDVRVGRIVDVEQGRPYVEFDAAAGHRVLARVAMTGLRDTPAAMLRGHPVLLVLENGDPALPIIVGLVSDVLPGTPGPSAGDAQDSFEIDGRRVSFEGREEVVLRCGHASITLRADGQVVVNGTRLMSRASETNKIRGASVLIN